MFTKRVDSKLLVLIGTYMDDSLICGNIQVLNLIGKTLEKFVSKARELDDTNFVGVSARNTNFAFELSQEKCRRPSDSSNRHDV